MTTSPGKYTAGHRRFAALALTCALTGLLAGTASVLAATATVTVSVPQPYITAVSPNSVPADTPVDVDVYGNGFSDDLATIDAVSIGPYPAGFFEVESSTELLVTVPDMPAGTYGIVAQRSDGVSTIAVPSGANVLTVSPVPATPTPVPTASPSPSISPSPTLVPSPGASPRPSPSPSPAPRSSGGGGGPVGAVVHAVTATAKAVGHVIAASTHAVVTFVAKHTVISITFFLALIALFLAFLLMKRRKKEEPESHLKL